MKQENSQNNIQRKNNRKPLGKKGKHVSHVKEPNITSVIHTSAQDQMVRTYHYNGPGASTHSSGKTCSQGKAEKRKVEDELVRRSDGR